MTEHKNTWLDHLLHLAFRNAITGFGVSLVTISFLAIVSLLLLMSLQLVESPYIGILAFLILPAFFVSGLVVIPVGMWMARRHHAAEGTTDKGQPLPRLDLNDPRVRRTAWIVVLLTFVNVVVVASASYEGIHYMESTAFCGEVCHPPMLPEFTAAYQSPHSTVGCVECHVGPGAEGFIKAKMGGVRQLISYMTDTYNRPIPVPVHNMVPAEHSCEECHWTDKDYGDIMVVKTKYSEDEVNTPLTTALMMHVGGPGKDRGIHSYHLAEGRTMEFYRDEEDPDVIPYVRVTEADGNVIEYTLDGSDFDAASIDESHMRKMDCIDCHSRPAHQYELPDEAVDQAIADGRLPVDKPFIKAAAVQALRGAAEEGAGPDFIASSINEYYGDHDEGVMAAQADELKTITAELEKILARNVFPDMKITWETYPDQSGHTTFSGCFRCHDDLHASSDGEHMIGQDCMACHNVIAWDEENPDILTMINP